MLRGLFTTVLAAVTMATFAAPVALAQGGGVSCKSYGACTIIAESPGTAGSQRSGGEGGGGPAGDGGGGGSSGPPGVGCLTMPISGSVPGAPPGATSVTTCAGRAGGTRRVVGYGVPGGGGPAPVIVDPAVLAQQAIERMQLAAPRIRLSAPPDRGFVGVPVWLWQERSESTTGPITRSASAGAVTVTATARVARVEWRMGPPGEMVVCRGPGTPWRGQSGPSPDCGYTYQLRSLPERTGGSGRWTITATNVWMITWEGGGASGSDVVRRSSSTSLAVGEVQVVVTSGGGQ